MPRAKAVESQQEWRRPGICGQTSVCLLCLSLSSTRLGPPHTAGQALGLLSPHKPLFPPPHLWPQWVLRVWDFLTENVSPNVLAASGRKWVIWWLVENDPRTSPETWTSQRPRLHGTSKGHGHPPPLRPASTRNASSQVQGFWDGGVPDTADQHPSPLPRPRPETPPRCPSCPCRRELSPSLQVSEPVGGGYS